MRSGVRWVVAVPLALVVTVAAGTLLPFTPAARADDPTWAQVEAAKKNVTAKAHEVAVIQAALTGLEAQDAKLGAIALQRAAAAASAADRLAAAEQTLHTLQTEAAAADARARSATRTAGAVATQLYRGGDPELSLWLSGTRSGSLLSRLGALQQIGGTSSALVEQASEQERQAAAFGAQAAAQTTVRDRMAQAAQAASNLAKQAQAVADAQVAQTKARTARLQAQLKALQATSESLQASYASAQAAKRAAAAAGDGDGGGGTLGTVAGGPDSLSPAAAQSYAASQLGSFGWSSGQMGCLVQLWNIESGWRWNAYNASSGAYGIPQALPGSKMAAQGGDWTTSSTTQIGWGLGYIKARYSTPCGALAFETSHTPYWY